jgi:DNA gyrase subunit A
VGVVGVIPARARVQVVSALIPAAADAAAARAALQVRLDLTERQADAVLAMPLRRLTGLEQESLRKETDDLRAERTRLRVLLDDRDSLLEAMVGELKALRKRYATPRRTRLVAGGDDLVAQRAAAVRPNTERQRQQAFEALAADSRLLIQADGQVRIVTPQMLGRLHLEEAAELGEHPAPARVLLPVSQEPSLLAFSASGRVAQLRWEFAGQQHGNLERFLPEGLAGDRLVQVVALPKQPSGSLGLLSTDGRFKRLPIEDFLDLSGRAASVLKLKDGVELQRVVRCDTDRQLVVASSTGRVLRLSVNDADLPLMGRTAQGPVLLRLLPGETVVGATSVAPDGSVLLATALGRIKRLAVAELRLCQRGDLGQIGLRFLEREDQLVDLQGDGSAVVAVQLSGSPTRSLRRLTADLVVEGASEPGLDLGLPAGSTVQGLVPLNG